MPPIKHALLGASKAEQWLNCPPSVIWEQSFPERETSDAAAEGTLAHAIAEERLRRMLEGKKPLTSARNKKNPLWHPAMDEHVETYTAYVWDAYQEARRQTSDALLLLEQRLDFSDFVPDGFGTGDAILIADGLMQVFDLKFGKGVPVDAKDNPQIRLYALGATGEFSDLYDIDAVTMHIVQPRLDNITSETMQVSMLRKWGGEYVKPRAELAARGEGNLLAGEHCRWCRCRSVCRAYGNRQVEIAKYRFADNDAACNALFTGDWSGIDPEDENLPASFSDEEIASILLGVDGLVRWAKSIKDYALEQSANHGVTYPGWKLVEGRANRKLTDEKKAASLLMREGYGTDEIMTLKGIGDLEELVGKKTLASVLEGILIKPAGKPVLAPEDDRRPAISSAENAKAVFAAVEDVE